jgi:hypothetical protein
MATRKCSLLYRFAFVAIGFLASLPANAQGAPTITALTSPTTTITVGDTVTFTATVTVKAPGTGTPTGLVTFFDDGRPVGSGTLNGVAGNDQATFSTSVIALAIVNPTTESITAVYNGDATFAGSQSSVFALTVQHRGSSTSLALKPPTVLVGQPSTATATVADTGTSFPPGTPDTFAATGAPATGRTGFTATFFADGLVLVAGGSDQNGIVLQSAEIYSISGPGFTTTGNLNTARTGAVAVLLPNGKVLIAGGSSDGTAANALDIAELFDPISGTFTLAGSGNTTNPNPNHMTAARLGHTATLLNNGQVLLAGGQNLSGVLNSAELYDPVADTFTSTANLNTARTGAAAALMLSDNILLIAGGSSDGTAAGALDTAELFHLDGMTGTFTPVLQTMTTPRFQATAAILPNRLEALVAGGVDRSGTALASGDLFNLRVTKFVQVSNQMSTGRVNASAIALPNSEVLLIGGVDSGTQAADLYDFLGNKFVPTGALLQIDGGAVGALLDNGQVLVVGLTTAATPASDAELYTPSFAPLGPVIFSSSSTADIPPGSGCFLTPIGLGVPTDSSCTFAVTPASFDINPHVITANYEGDSVHGGNSATADLTATSAATTTVVTSSANPSIFGQAVTFTATVTANPPSTTAPPTGSVLFTVDGVSFGPITLAAASPNSSTASIPAGTLSVSGSPHSVTATYTPADSSFTAGSPGTLSGGQAITAASTTTAVVSLQNPSGFAQPVTFTATVSNITLGSTQVPTGNVEFVIDGISTATVPLTAGAASLMTSTLSAGGSPHTIKANYLNVDQNFINSSSAVSGGQTVAPASTATAVGSSLNPSFFGQAVTFTATVTDTASGVPAAPTGSVVFVIDGVNSAPVALSPVDSADSTASLSTSTLTVSGSPHSVTAKYVNGDGNFSNSSADLSPGQSVAQTGVTVTITPSAATITVGDTVTFTATVTPTFGTGTPTGLVTFFDGNTPIGNGILNETPGNDQATFSTSLLAATLSKPPHSISAIYDGDSNFTSLGGGTFVTVKLRGITTSVALNPDTVFVGQQTTATVTVNDAGPSSPPGTPDVFSSTGASATGRTGFTPVLFGDGLVLVAGGTDANKTVLKSAEIYSVSGAGFVPANGNLNTARTGAVAVLLFTGQVLIAGGSSDGTANGALASAEIFDPVAGTFTPTSHNMTAFRFGAMATLLSNGLVLLSGGQNSGGVLNTAELYDPLADTFTATGNLNTARTGSSSTLVANGQVLIAGGSSDGTANGALNTAELFDPAGNSGAGAFTLLTATLSDARWQPEAALVFGQDVLIAGGQNSNGELTSADRFNSFPGDFSAIPNPMAVGRANGSAVALPSGMVLLAGGAGSSQVVELFDPSNSIFLATGNLLQSESGLAATLLNNGQVLAVGLTSGMSPQADAELYSPSFNPSGPLQVQASDPSRPTLFVCHLVPSTNSATAATCTVTFAPLSAAANPDVFAAGHGFGTIDGVHSPSVGTANLALNPASTSTAVASSLNPSAFGELVTFTATVTDSAPGSSVPPTGTVQFVVDGANLGSPTGVFTVSGNSGTASVSTSSLTASNSPHSVTANFVNADGNFVNSTGTLPSGQSVTPASTTTAVVSSVPSPVYGQAVSFTATVTNAGPGSAQAPTGSVQFVVDGQNFGAPVALTAGSNSSTATSGSIATLAVNGGSPHAVLANYLNADPTFVKSDGSLSGGLQVSPAHLAITANNHSKTYNAATFTGFTATLSGFVNGESDAGLRGSGALSGTAAFTGPAVSAINAGLYAITPAQGTLAASNYDFPAADFASGTLTILKANTTSLTTEASTPLNDAVNGGSLSFLVVVTSTTGGTPTGSVQFTDDKTAALATVALLSTASCPSGTPATASCAKFSPAAGQLAAGSQTITAAYQGDGNFNGASSGSTPSSVGVTVETAINTSPGATIPPQVITFENGATLAAQNLTLSCVVQAAAIPASSQFPACSLSSTSLPQSGSVTITLTTAAPTTAALTGTPSTVASSHTGSAHPNPLSAALGLPAIGFLGLVLMTARRRKKTVKRSSRRAQAFVGLTLMVTTLLLLVSCGGGGSSPGPGPHTVGGTPTGTYLVSVVGSDVNHNPVVVATIPLNVQ